MMVRSVVASSLGLAALVFLGTACDPIDEAYVEASTEVILEDANDGDPDPYSLPTLKGTDANVLLELKVSTGNRYLFLDVGVGGVVAMEIGVPGAPSLREYSELDGSNPGEVFLAVAPPGTQTPAALRPYVERARVVGEQGWASQEWESLDLANRPQVSKVICSDSGFHDLGDASPFDPYDSESYGYNQTFASGDDYKRSWVQWVSEWYGGVCVQNAPLGVEIGWNVAWAGNAPWPCNESSFPPLEDNNGTAHATHVFADWIFTNGAYVQWWWQCPSFPHCHSNKDLCTPSYDDEYGYRWIIGVHRELTNTSASFDRGQRWSLRWP